MISLPGIALATSISPFARTPGPPPVFNTRSLSAIIIASSNRVISARMRRWGCQSVLSGLWGISIVRIGSPCPHSGRRFLADLDRDTCKWRHLIENFFGKFKEHRCIAMRCCKTDESFSVFISSRRPSFACGERQQTLCEATKPEDVLHLKMIEEHPAFG